MDDFVSALSANFSIDMQCGSVSLGLAFIEVNYLQILLSIMKEDLHVLLHVLLQLVILLSQVTPLII